MKGSIVSAYLLYMTLIDFLNAEANDTYPPRAVAIKILSLLSRCLAYTPTKPKRDKHATLDELLNQPGCLCKSIQSAGIEYPQDLKALVSVVDKPETK